jgi:hypothetical protein
LHLSIRRRRYVLSASLWRLLVAVGYCFGRGVPYVTSDRGAKPFEHFNKKRKL